MRIVMMTNTYLPHVSGVAQSVARFTDALRDQGHDVLVVAPEYEEQPDREDNVLRVPALQHFNGSDLSVALPIPMYLTRRLNEFGPDLIHAHHPFLIGDTALRTAAARQLPLIFTHHTMYEQYTHYVPFDAPNLARAVVKLSTGYANRCDHVVAPSAAVARVLRRRGVVKPIAAIPTGVATAYFVKQEDAAFRESLNIPKNAFIVGHVGRLAPEKNLGLLARAASVFLRDCADAYLVIAGDGPSVSAMRETLREAGVLDRARFTGPLSGDELIAAYSAFDVFLFTSKSETQGMVLVEAMAVGVPVVALNAAPVDEVVTDKENGRLVDDEDPGALAEALNWVRELKQEARQRLGESARALAERFDTRRCARDLQELYEDAVEEKRGASEFDEADWHAMLDLIREEWEIWTNRIAAATTALSKEEH